MRRSLPLLLAAAPLAALAATGAHAKGVDDLSSLVQTSERSLLSRRGHGFNSFLQKSCRNWAMGLVECLPDIMLVGQSKAGTTSLSEALLHHPQIDMQVGRRQDVEMKDKELENEVHLFDYHLRTPQQMLAEHWTTAPKLSPFRAHHALQLQYTPNYMYYPDAPFNILDVYPTAHTLKYLFMLREPVKRAVSGWRFHTTLTGEWRPFHLVVDQGMQQRKNLEACYAQVLPKRNATAKHVEDLPRRDQRSIINQCFWGHPNTHDTTLPPEQIITLMHAHVDKGIYVDQLRRWFNLMGRENCYVLTLEDWIKDPDATFKGVTEFLGLQTTGAKGYKSKKELEHTLHHRMNSGSNIEMPEPKPSTLKRLEEFYKPYNEELFKLLGKRLW